MTPGFERNRAPWHASGNGRVHGPRGCAGGTLIGVFIGVVLGLGLAAGVAFYLMRANSPYQSTTGTNREARGDVAASRPGKSEPGQKPRFDFYKILPGGEEPKVQAKAADRGPDRTSVERSITPPESRTQQGDTRPAEPKAIDRFWLQAGSFANPGDAENLKARLALAGWEAAVQEAAVPDKGVRYRVRLGPYDNTDELNRIKGDLARRGFDVAVIKF